MLWVKIEGIGLQEFVISNSLLKETFWIDLDALHENI